MSTETRDPPNILVVDDTVENLRLLSRILGEHGYETRAMTSGRQALQAIEQDPPDLVLLDITMPDLSGFDVCAHLKGSPLLRDIPVIFLTALTSTPDKVRAFEVGGVDYVTKPFQVEEVLARVRTHVALRRAQAALTASYERLRALEQLRDDMVQMVVHDMRSPLTVLLGSLEMLQLDLGDALAGDADEEWRASMRAAMALRGMADDVLDVSRLEVGELPIEPADIDLAALAGDVRDELVRLDRDRTIELAAPGPVVVCCDAGVVRRVIENFVSNGVKHTPPKTPLRIDVAPGTGWARLAVHDQGPGVPIEARGRIFDKFVSLRAGARPAYRSSGLGLAFCRLAIQAHGGRIGVDTGASGQGSIFWFELPT